ncbi:HAD-IA family hydrolase [Sphingopyxis macrogoltabida]|uniref:Phosphoglycolate phosphatase n=1 Tax=Sphingopyxis macrogoltabida TaxID=33050 RepID=A0AAC8Z0I5_SPHMC|nr:HAD-IA family hydrolase [Sphingopyxis macrogoltabida]ALJ13187.1 phosphoglycolate phosphatase [Sphingopyxis macrogoltabida]AMU89347.1 phosphoglycolate phosphatase [Sphingopyxis macrogoltabida]
MNDFPFRIVGFDLDGTLVDTAGDLTAAVNHALSLVGRAPLPEAAVRPMIGLGAKHMLEQGLAATGGVPDGDVERLYPELLRYYEDHIAVHSRPFPGLIEALDRLDALGVRTAVVTNKMERLARILLGELGLADRMATIIGGDTLGVRKPAAEPILAMIERCGGGRTAFVGDSIYDVMAATNAGVPSIAVSFGFLDRPAADLGADHVIDDYGELIPLLETL